MRTWTLRVAALAAAAVALVYPQAVPARIVDIASASVTVGTTATDLSLQPLRPRHVLVCNLSGNAVIYIGGESVTAATGIPLRPGDCYASGERVDPGVRYHAISTASADVRVMEHY